MKKHHASHWNQDAPMRHLLLETCGKSPSGSQAMRALQLHLEVCQNLYESAFSQYMSRLSPCVIPLLCLRDQRQSEIKEKPAIFIITGNETHLFVTANSLLDFNRCPCVFQLFLDFIGQGFSNTLFNGFGCSFNQILGFFQAKTRDFTNSFNNVDFVLANGC